VVICLEWGAHLHLAQLMPLPLTVSCFSKIQIGFIFLVQAHPGSPGQRAIKWVCLCVLFSSSEVTTLWRSTNLFIILLNKHQLRHAPHLLLTMLNVQ